MRKSPEKPAVILGRCPRCRADVAATGRHFTRSAHACPTCGVLLRQRPVWRIVGMALIMGPGILLSRLVRSGTTPLWAFFAWLLLLPVGIVVVALGFRLRVVADGPFCPSCLYDLSATGRGAPCPECGTRRNAPR